MGISCFTTSQKARPTPESKKSKPKKRLNAVDQHLVDSYVHANRYMKVSVDGVWVDLKDHEKAQRRCR
jgi:hypothetical protein